MNVLHSDTHYAKSHTDTYHVGNKVANMISICVTDFKSDRERALNITVYILNKYRRCENKIKRYIYLFTLCSFYVNSQWFIAIAGL